MKRGAVTLEYDIITGWVEAGSAVLDLGCEFQFTEYALAATS